MRYVLPASHHQRAPQYSQQQQGAGGIKNIKGGSDFIFAEISFFEKTFFLSPSGPFKDLTVYTVGYTLESTA